MMDVVTKRVSRGFARVKLDKKDYLVPANKPFQLMRITSHPLNPNKFLVWRQEKSPTRINIFINEAKRGKNRLEEEHEVASLESSIGEKKAVVHNFEVDPRLFGKTLRVAMREALVRELRNRSVDEVSFPPYCFYKFYEAAGIKRVEPPYVGYTGKLSGYKPKAGKIALKVVWQRPVPPSRKQKGRRLPKPIQVTIDGFV